MAYYASPSGVGDGLSVGSPGSIATVRALARAATGAQTIFLRGGSYDFAAGPLALDSDDSGTGGEILWRSFPGEFPIFEGGRAVTGWVLHDAGRNIWRADVPGGTLTRQLWVNGARAQRVRGAASIASSFSTADGGFTYVSNNASVPAFARPQDVEFAFQVEPTTLYVPFNWLHDRLVAISVSRVGNTTTVTMDAAMVPRLLFWDAGRRWLPSPLWVENAYEFLDSTTKGSWYHDAGANRIYYVPRDGEDMATADAWIPVAERLITGSGLSDVAFEGIGFRHCGWTAPITDKGYLGQSIDGFISRQNAWATIHQPAAIEIPNSTRVRIRRCLFEHLGGAGVDALAAAAIEIRSNIFRDISVRAVSLGGYDQPNVTDPLLRSNFVDQASVEYMTDAIGMGDVVGAQVLHNEIRRSSYAAVGIHSANPDSASNEYGWNRIIGYVEELGDGGALYAYTAGAAQQAGAARSRMHHNVVQFTRATPAQGASALYLDNFTRSWDMDGNVVLPNGQAWLQTQTDSIDHEASGNFAAAGSPSLIGGSGHNIQAPTELVGADPAGWPAGAQVVWVDAGLDPEDADLLSYVDGAPIYEDPVTTTTTTGAPGTTLAPSVGSAVFIGGGWFNEDPSGALRVVTRDGRSVGVRLGPVLPTSEVRIQTSAGRKGLA